MLAQPPQRPLRRPDDPERVIRHVVEVDERPPAVPVEYIPPLDPDRYRAAYADTY